MQESRICSKCGIEKPLTIDFFNLNGKYFRWDCKECHNRGSKINHNNNKKRDNKNSNKWYLNNREKHNSFSLQSYYIEKLDLKFLEKRKIYSRKYRIVKGLSTGDIQSVEEKQIEQFLKNKNFNFETEKTFEDCRNERGNLLFFDFFLPKLNIIIEYDGIHHYKPIFGEENLRKKQIHDQIKNDYCLIKGIQLIRISYQDNLEEELNKILSWHLKI